MLRNIARHVIFNFGTLHFVFGPPCILCHQDDIWTHTELPRFCLDLTSWKQTREIDLGVMFTSDGGQLENKTAPNIGNLEAMYYILFH